MKQISKEDFFNQLNSCESGKLYINRVTNEEYKITKGGERHHIHPVFLGAEPGMKVKSNIVRLSYFNHIIAHIFLAKAAIELNASWKYEALHTLTEFTRRQINQLSDIEAITIEDVYQFSKLRELAHKEHGKHWVENWNNKPDEEKTEIIKKRLETINNKSEEEKAEIRKKHSEASKGEKNGFYGKTFTEEQRKHLSEVHLGKPSGRKGCKFSEEHKAKLKEAAKNRVMPPCSEEKKKKISLANKGKRRTEEQKKYISIKTKEGQLKISDEAKERMKTMKGKHWSEEHKQNISRIMKDRYNDPNERKRIGEASKKVWKNMSDEERHQRSINTSIGVRKGQAKMTDEAVKLMKLHQSEARLNKKLMTLGIGMPKKYVSIELIPEYELNGWYWCDRNGNKKVA